MPVFGNSPQHSRTVFGDSPQQSPRSSVALPPESPDPPPGPHPADCDHSALSSPMLTLKDVLEGTQSRGYGSPVMALKESIDNHFNNSYVPPRSAAQHSPPAPAPAPAESETYLYPVASASNGTAQASDQLDSSSQEVSENVLLHFWEWVEVGSSPSCAVWWVPRGVALIHCLGPTQCG